MALCRFIDTVYGMSLVVNGGPFLFNSFCCLRRGLGPTNRVAMIGHEMCFLVTLCWGEWNTVHPNLVAIFLRLADLVSLKWSQFRVSLVVSLALVFEAPQSPDIHCRRTLPADVVPLRFNDPPRRGHCKYLTLQ